MTTITFTDKRVTGIGTGAWDGTWAKETLKPHDVLIPDDELVQREKTIEAMAAAILPSDKFQRVVDLAGAPHAHDLTYTQTGAYKAGSIYYRAPSETIVIRFEEGVVARVERLPR